jgi:TonB family protein
VTAVAAAPRITTQPAFTNIEVISKPPVQYTSEARQLKVQGDVVLRVTFTAAGQVVLEGVVRGLGHGLDEEARRVAQQIRERHMRTERDRDNSSLTLQTVSHSVCLFEPVDCSVSMRRLIVIY